MGTFYSAHTALFWTVATILLAAGFSFLVLSSKICSTCKKKGPWGHFDR